MIDHARESEPESTESSREDSGSADGAGGSLEADVLRVFASGRSMSAADVSFALGARDKAAAGKISSIVNKLFISRRIDRVGYGTYRLGGLPPEPPPPPAPTTTSDPTNPTIEDEDDDDAACARDARRASARDKRVDALILERVLDGAILDGQTYERLRSRGLVEERRPGERRSRLTEEGRRLLESSRSG